MAEEQEGKKRKEEMVAGYLRHIIITIIITIIINIMINIMIITIFTCTDMTISAVSGSAIILFLASQRYTALLSSGCKGFSKNDLFRRIQSRL